MCLTAVVVLVVSGKNTAQPLQHLSLDKAIALARENKPALRTFAIGEEINAARLAEMRLQRGVQLSAAADAQVNPFLPASVIPVGQFNLQNPTDETATVRFGTWWQASVGFTAGLPLYDAALKAQIREEEFQSRLTANDLEAAGTTVAADVIRAYYALLLAEAEFQFIESDLARANAFLADAENRRSEGAALSADVNSARMQVNDAHLRLEQARENQRLARENLVFRLGLPAERAPELALGETLTDILNRIGAKAGDSFDPAAAEQNRPDLRRFELDNQLQDLKIETEKARLCPTLSASAFFGLNNLSDKTPLFAEKSWFTNGNVALRLSIPLSGYWEWKTRIAPLSLKQQQNAAQLDDLRQQLRFEFTSANSAYALAKRQLPVREQDIDLARANLELARASYAGGGGLASAVTDAETTLQQKQFAWLQAAYDLLLAELNMRLARGEIK